jgi:hypothetical protein
MKSLTLRVIPAQTAVWQLMLILVVPLILLPAGLSFFLVSKQDGMSPLITVALLGTTLATGIGLLLGMRWALRRCSAELLNGNLKIRAGTYTHERPISNFDLAAAAAIDLDQNRDWRPQWRSNGIGLPGFQAGHFRRWSIPKRKLFCLLTDNRHVLALPGRDGVDVLISVEQPQRALDALRAAAAQV